MNRSRAWIALATGTACGLAAFFILQGKAREIASRTTPLAVVVSTRYIPAGSFLEEGMVEIREIPKAYVEPGALAHPNEVEGLRALVPLSAGEQVLSNKFGTGNAGLSGILLPGRRAWTLSVDGTSGVGGLLRPGDSVDFVARVASKGREITAFALQDLEILAVGQDLAAPGSIPRSEGGYGTVTLSVTPQQAETLMYLEGRPFRLALRAAGDKGLIELEPRSEREILSQLGRFPAETRKRSVEVIRGRDSLGGME